MALGHITRFGSNATRLVLSAGDDGCFLGGAVFGCYRDASERIWITAVWYACECKLIGFANLFANTHTHAAALRAARFG